VIYLGGAVDVGDPGMNHQWRHEGWEGLDIYCPVCACQDLTGPLEILDRNNRALEAATDAVFVLDAFSVGTPIEAWHRIAAWGLGGVIVYPHDRRSVFVDFMALMQGTAVVKTLGEARALLRERASRSVNAT
jgi:hypothetical protein